ncbi:MAG: hypothetical protein ACI8VY_001449, partial [Cellvibrionaceae bacterium]
RTPSNKKTSRNRLFIKAHFYQSQLRRLLCV